jgi:hypothetical protein
MESIEDKISKLKKSMDNGFNSIGNKIDEHHEQIIQEFVKIEHLYNDNTNKGLSSRRYEGKA